MIHKLKNKYIKEFSHLRKSWATEETSQFGDPAKGLGIPRESDYEGQQDLITEFSQDWGNKRLLGGYKQNPVRTRTQVKGAATPQEAEPDLPVFGSLWQRCGWVDSGLPKGQGQWQQQS